MTTMTPKYAFFGTPQVAVWVLDEMEAAGILPVVVVTAPDKPAGRGMQLSTPPVKVWAQTHGIPVLQPEKLDREFRHALAEYACDVFLVAAYGKILRSSVLALPATGCVNVHPSLLPKHRGPSPIESQILADDEAVGVSLMLMDEEMDHGPVIAQERIAMEEWPIGRTAFAEMLARAGGRLAVANLAAWVAGSVTASPQDHDAATYTRKIEKQDGEISLTDTPRENYLKYCAYEGWPGVYFFAEKDGKRIRVNIKRASYTDGAFVVERIVPEGKAEQDFATFVQNGWRY